MKSEKQKAIVLLSNGLDSRLVVKIMQERGYDVVALHMKFPFGKNVVENIEKFCLEQKVKLKIFDFTKGKLFEDYMKIIRKPKFGHGTAMNPCVDCRILALKNAKKYADEKGIRIIATGEVESQRPMSQTKKKLKIVKEESGLGERLVRPLDEMGLKGRQRKAQIALAKKFGIDFPAPAGGCLLCEKEYCKKLNKILENKPSFSDIELLSIGRHFQGSEIILGKDKKENEFLQTKKGIKIIPKQSGPTALIKDEEYVEKAKKLIQKYSKNKIRDFEVIR